METLINVLIAAVSFYIGGRLLSGVEMKDFLQCVLVAVVVGLLDVTLGTVLKIITLGLLSFVLFWEPLCIWLKVPRIHNSTVSPEVFIGLS